MNKTKLTLSIFLGIVISLILFIVYLIGTFDEDWKKTIQLDILRDDLNDKNLKLIDEKDIIGNWQSDKDLDEWHIFLKSKYVYNKKYYDCKYWSLNWALYFEKHKVNFQFITIKNHMFVIADYEDYYCIADQNILECTDLIK